MFHMLHHLRHEDRLRYYAVDPYEKFNPKYEPGGRFVQQRGEEIEAARHGAAGRGAGDPVGPRFVLIKDGISSEDQESCQRVRDRVLADVAAGGTSTDDGLAKSQGAGDQTSQPRQSHQVLDLAFIDANGPSGLLLAQIRCLLPMMKQPDGVIAGHDFATGGVSWSKEEYSAAVDMAKALDEWHADETNPRIALRTRPDSVWWLTFDQTNEVLGTPMQK
ncbi:unnamed protein product [Amoebophrya sp. A120]|nr:unnamed protein product [Amoebophrya sp. A120]|eukprot:GSA120T00020590001.1